MTAINDHGDAMRRLSLVGQITEQEAVILHATAGKHPEASLADLYDAGFKGWTFERIEAWRAGNSL